MNAKNIKILIGASLLGLAFATSAVAQDAPDASVNDQGQLVLGDGSVIDVPAGTVDGNGDLVLDSGTIAKPVATVNPDGSLTVGDMTYLVPDGPPSDNAFITWFNQGDSTTLQYDNTLSLDADQWHWSYYFKGMFHAPSIAETTIWMREFGSFFYFAVDSGLGSPAGVWTYGFDFPVDGSGTWTWIAGNNFAPTVEGNDVIDGWLYLTAPYAKWYKVKEFDTLAEPGTYLYADGENYRLTTTP